MAARLRQDAVPRIHEEDRQIGVGSAGRHVAGVMLVARRIGDDELARIRGEEAIGDVDRDALLALGGQSIDEEGEIEFVLGRAALAVGNRARERRAGPRSGAWCRRGGGR